MQSVISVEDFSKFQSQFLELRDLKCKADEARQQAIKRASELEVCLAQQSGELAEARSALSRVQRAGDINNVVQENQDLRLKLINIESSFHLQVATLRSECERLQEENNILLSSLKLAGVSSEDVFKIRTDAFSQTDNASLVKSKGITTQTVNLDRRIDINDCAACQTDVSADNYAALQASIVDKDLELNAAMQDRIEERLSWGQQHDDILNQLEMEKEKLKQTCEDVECLRSELVTASRKHEHVQKELRRQLSIAIRIRASSSSLVYVNSPDFNERLSIQNDPVHSRKTSTGSICREFTHGQNCSETSSLSQENNTAATSTAADFTEEDFRGLLNRLSEVQEANCDLRRQIGHLNNELASKSTLIQHRLDEKYAPISFTNFPSHAGINKEIKCVETPKTDILSVAMDTVRSKLRISESGSVAAHKPCPLSSNSVELRGLKLMCEELMTRNIMLEQALEKTLSVT